MAKIKRIFMDLNNGPTEGVAFKNFYLKKQILAYFASTGNATIPELSKVLNFSSPKIAEIINNLTEENLVKNYGKTGAIAGRRPIIYGLNPNSLFFVGADIKNDYINVGLLDFNNKMISVKRKVPYKLANTQESLDSLCKILQTFISGSKQKDKIAGVGINLTGRINYKTGYSYSYFHFSEEPLSKVLSQKLGLPVSIENDSRAMAYGEFSCGIVKDEKNVIFINIDYGIGAGIMIDGRLCYGKSGFAGEIGHIPIFDNEIICQCGKKGCLETEASGSALTKLFIQKIKEGSSSIVTKKNPKPDTIKLEDIIEAANTGDVLAIELIAIIGERLGRGIAVLINLYNPELVILGGSLSSTEALIRLPIKSAVQKYAISIVNNDTVLKMSSLKEDAGIIGACLLFRDRLLGRELQINGFSTLVAQK